MLWTRPTNKHRKFDNGSKAIIFNLEIDSETKNLAKSDPNSNDLKIRANQHSVVTKSFLDIMMEYKRIQESYQDKYKDRMQRQALIVKPNATSEEVLNMINGDKGQMFANQVGIFYNRLSIPDKEMRQKRL